MRTKLVLLALGLGAVSAGCNPEEGDSGSCSAYSCAVTHCASHGYTSGRCIDDQCVCDGTSSGECVDANCAAACRVYGASGGACVSPTRCECTGMPDAGGGDDAGGPPDTWTGSWGAVEGIVMSPGGILPISGALVYAQPVSAPVAPIPEGNYCPRCLDMTLLPHTFSLANGFFRLDHIGLGDWWLVVQKGQFRRFRQITLSTDGEVVSVPIDYSTLPNASDPANGDSIPHIAVALGSYDTMEDILAKISLAGLTYDYHAELGSAVFDVYDNGGGGFGSGERPFSDLVTDPRLMAQYHIIFVPCSSSTTDDYLENRSVQENIRNWVRDGGKWYVADWSYEWAEFMFPEAMDMQGDDTVIGDADMMSSSYDGDGHVVDPDLAAWLTEVGHDPENVVFEEIWDNICGLGTLDGVDEDGAPVTITPYTWAEGPQEHPCGGGDYPYTITFPYGCGKVLFTTYHTVGPMAGTHADLLAQEKILLYLIMEIGVCTDEVIIW
jgi:hypothetical protein